jgi:hypothetical protein
MLRAAHVTGTFSTVLSLGMPIAVVYEDTAVVVVISPVTATAPAGKQSAADLRLDVPVRIPFARTSHFTINSRPPAP